VEPRLVVQLATDPAEYNRDSPMGRFMLDHGYYWALFVFPIHDAEIAVGEPQYAKFYWAMARN